MVNESPARRCDSSSGVDGDLQRIVDTLEMSDGVFKPNAGSIALAASVRGLSGSFLDLGTGTGFISIVIARSAGAVLATDCSAAAVECARRNFRRFGVHAEVRVSDMFEQVAETFDYIAFNPPFHPRETELDRRFKNRLKRLLPGSLNAFASAVARPIFKHSRRTVLASFYLGASRYLKPGGALFVNTIPSDFRWLSGWIAGRARLTECRRSAEYCIVEIAPSGSSTKAAEAAHRKEAG